MDRASLLPTGVSSTGGPPFLQGRRQVGGACGQGYLHHIHEVAEAGVLVDGQATGTVVHAVVDDVTAKADAQHVVAGVSGGLPHQEQPVLGGLQLLHCLGA